MLSVEPTWGLNPETLRGRPELRSRIRYLTERATQAPPNVFEKHLQWIEDDNLMPNSKYKHSKPALCITKRNLAKPKSWISKRSQCRSKNYVMMRYSLPPLVS